MLLHFAWAVCIMGIHAARRAAELRGRGMVLMDAYVDPKSLESGAVLLLLKSRFIKDRGSETLFPLLGCLRDSVVHVPMQAILSEADQRRMAAMKLGDTWRNRDPVRMRPDVLKMADGTVWFPIFSQIEQAPADYRRRFSVVSVEAMQALRMAHAAGGLSGLVLDPFTDPVSLPFQTADIMAEMPSSLSPDGAADEA